MEQVMDNMEVEIPDAMVEYEADNLVNDMAQRIQAQGIPFDQYLAMTGMTMDIMREQAKAAALERVRRELALEPLWLPKISPSPTRSWRRSTSVWPSSITWMWTR